MSDNEVFYKYVLVVLGAVLILSAALSWYEGLKKLAPRSDTYQKGEE